MNRKWTLDRIEFDNETYEIIRPEASDAPAPAAEHPQRALQLGLSLAADQRFSRQSRIPEALIAATMDIDEPVFRDPDQPSSTRQVH
ncbi:MAG TPA: hypothetical protein VIS73_03965 [Rhodocyclaceae bacterium]